ncbi:MAG: AMP-binding protein [Acidimicrobiia bacterium]
MIEWLRRAEPSRPFLRFEGTEWSYGETVEEVELRASDDVTFVKPRLDPDSVFDILAGLSGGVLIVGSPGGFVGGGGGSRLVVYTSGTTGAPKGVRLTMANLEAASRASARHLGHGADDDWLLAMPLHHVGGLSILVRQAFTGGSVTMLPGFETESFVAAMRRKVTMVSVVPTMLRRIIGHEPFDGLRAVLVGGGPIPDGILEEAVAAGLPVLPTYGLTETFGQVATLRPGSPVERKAHPLPGVELRIEPDGRIAVRGDQVSPGYAGEPDREDSWFVTSDLGSLDDEGALRVLGRADAVIVTGGENVSPERVEAVATGCPGVEEAVVFGVPDDEWGQVVACVYIGEASAVAVADWVAARVAGYAVPKRWARVESIPRTGIGKPDRVAAARLL